MPVEANPTGDRTIIDGSEVVARQVAVLPHPRTKTATTYQDIDEVLLADGRTIYQCNSRYGNCLMFHENAFSVFAHIRYHTPTSQEKDRAKYQAGVYPGKDRVVRTPLKDDEVDSDALKIKPGEAAQVIMNFSGSSAQVAEDAERAEDVARLRDLAVKNGSHKVVAIEETPKVQSEPYGPERRSAAAQRAWDKRHGITPTVNDPESLGKMKIAGVVGHIESLIDAVHKIEVEAVKLQNALSDIGEKLENLELTDPEVAEKARKYDRVRDLLG